MCAVRGVQHAIWGDILHSNTKILAENLHQMRVLLAISIDQTMSLNYCFIAIKLFCAIFIPRYTHKLPSRKKNGPLVCHLSWHWPLGAVLLMVNSGAVPRHAMTAPQGPLSPQKINNCPPWPPVIWRPRAWVKIHIYSAIADVELKGFSRKPMTAL